MSTELYATPLNITDKSVCRFYHTMEYPDGEVIKGDWDLRGEALPYIGNVNVSGKRVMDMGAASGFMSFEMEKMGADVVSVDVVSAAQYTKVPYIDTPQNYDPSLLETTYNKGLQQMKNSYWYSWQKLGSKTKVHYGDLFNLPQELGLFDVSLIAQIMVHNRDPLGLLVSVARKTKDTLIISEGMEHSDQALAYFMPDVEAGIRPHGWLRFTTTALRRMLKIVGFDVEAITVKDYRCDIHGQIIPITTIVAKRVVPIP